MTRVLAGSLVLVFAVTSAAPAQDRDAPRWRLKKDQVFNYLFKHKEVRTVAIGGEKFVATTEHECAWRWTVQEADDDGALMELKFDSLKATVRGKDYAFAYESGRANDYQEPDKKKLVGFYDQVAFGKFRLRLDRRGVVKELSGFTKLCEDLNDPATTDVYGLSLRDGTLAWFLQQTLGVLPEGPLPGKDANWKHAVEKAIEPGQLAAEDDYALAERAKDGFTTRHKGKSTLEVDMKWSGSTLRGELKTTRQEGKHVWDARAGCVRTGAARLRAEGALKLNDAADMRITYEHTAELTRP